jgi:hypothetical protein
VNTGREVWSLDGRRHSRRKERSGETKRIWRTKRVRDQVMHSNCELIFTQHVVALVDKAGHAALKNKKLTWHGERTGVVSCQLAQCMTEVPKEDNVVKTNKPKLCSLVRMTSTPSTAENDRKIASLGIQVDF